MCDELKAYVRRHNLPELGETVKELFERYNISENYEPSRGSAAGSQVSAEGNQLSDDDVHSSSSSITDAEKLKPKSLGEIGEAKKANDETTQNDDPVKKTRKATPKNAASSKSGSEVRGRSTQKKPQKPIKKESVQVKDKVKKQGKKSALEEGESSWLA